MSLPSDSQRKHPKVDAKMLNEALSLHQSGSLDLAESLYRDLLRLSPDDTTILSNLATLALQKGSIDSGIKIIEKSLKINPKQYSALNNYGVMLQKVSRFAESVEIFNRAIKLKPDYAEAHANKANSLSELKQFNEAEESYDKAIYYKPNYLKAYLNRGKSLKQSGQLTKALSSFQEAQRLNPEIDFLSGEIFETKMHLGIWEDFDNNLHNLERKINAKKNTINPFPLLGLLDKPSLQKKNAEIYSSFNYQNNNSFSSINHYQDNSKIRIGYFSADFHNHATMHLMAELFENHDKNFFELVAFSFGPNIVDAWRKRIMKCFDEFLDVRLRSDHDIVLLSREKQIDIAIDLKGFTKDCRPNIFSLRCAPLQVSYLGFPGTMGSKFMDYLIADHILIPEKNKCHYSEKIVFMPNTYQANISKREVSNNSISRSDQDLPETGFIFCCFNNNYKITPSTFNSWMKILSRVENSVLWLFEKNSATTENLKKAAKNLGIDSQRLVFAKHMSVEDHLERIKLADLFLDTLPYNAHTTTSDALRMGLPVLTLIGESFASRVAASLLHAVNMSELITFSEDQYIKTAIKIASSQKNLEKIKKKLSINLSKSFLFDSKLFTKNLEDSFRQMYENQKNGLDLDDIYIKN